MIEFSKNEPALIILKKIDSSNFETLKELINQCQEMIPFEAINDLSNLSEFIRNHNQSKNEDKILILCNSMLKELINMEVSKLKGILDWVTQSICYAQAVSNEMYNLENDGSNIRTKDMILNSTIRFYFNKQENRYKFLLESKEKDIQRYYDEKSLVQSKNILKAQINKYLNKFDNNELSSSIFNGFKNDKLSVDFLNVIEIVEYLEEFTNILTHIK